METIKTEAKSNANLLIDIDNMRETFVDYNYDIQIQVKYPNPRIDVYENNLFILLANSNKVEFKSKWYQRPDYVSYEYYNTVIFWPLILYVNQVALIEDFYGFDNILVPSTELVFSICKDKMDNNKTFDVNQDYKTDKTTSKYYKNYPLDSKEIAIIKAKKVLENPFPEINTYDGGLLSQSVTDELDGETL